jgi:hypothetical protein
MHLGYPFKSKIKNQQEQLHHRKNGTVSTYENMQQNKLSEEKGAAHYA